MWCQGSLEPWQFGSHHSVTQLPSLNPEKGRGSWGVLVRHRVLECRLQRVGLSGGVGRFVSVGLLPRGLGSGPGKRGVARPGGLGVGGRRKTGFPNG